MARRFVDARGTEWEVWEVGARRTLADAAPPKSPSRAVRTAGPSAWLRFESATGSRRLAPYPEYWEALSAAELSALCAAARPELPPAARPLVVGLDDMLLGWPEG